MSTRLYMNGQDIGRLVLAIERAGESDIEIAQARPEDFLLTLKRFLFNQKVTPPEIDKFFVVVGSGSATALRASLSIANTFSFAFCLPLIGIKKKPIEQDLYTFKNCLAGSCQHAEQKKYLFPLYELPAKITLSTKDALGLAK